MKPIEILFAPVIWLGTFLYELRDIFPYLACAFLIYLCWTKISFPILRHIFAPILLVATSWTASFLRWIARYVPLKPIMTVEAAIRLISEITEDFQSDVKPNRIWGVRPLEILPLPGRKKANTKPKGRVVQFRRSRASS